MFNQHQLHRVLDWILETLKEYRDAFSPKDLEELKNKILAILEKCEILENALPLIVEAIQRILGLTGVILTIALVGTAYTLSFYIGKHFSRSFKLDPKWKPTKVDILVTGGTIIAVWLPGMSGWGSAAGSVLLTTSFGAVAVVPALVAISLTTGWYLGRRILG